MTAGGASFCPWLKNIVLSRIGNQPEKLAIFNACPARVRHSLNFMAGQVPAQARRQTFVEQNAHLCGGQHPLAGFFEKSDGLFAGDCQKILEEIVE